MLSFLLKHILKRSLSIPLLWGIIYPSIFGGIVVKDISLNKPAVDSADGIETTSVVSVERAELRPNWGTLFDDVLKLSNVQLYNVQADITLDSPLEIIHCLSNRACQSPRQLNQQRARLGSAASGSLAATAETAEDSENEVPEPLVLGIDALSIDGGMISIRRAQKKLQFEIAQGQGSNVIVPLRAESGELELDVYVVQGAKRSPLRIVLAWSPESQAGSLSEQRGTTPYALDVTLFSKDLPLSMLSALFPKLFVAEVSGTLSGKTTLRYSGTSGWSLVR